MDPLGDSGLFLAAATHPGADAGRQVFRADGVFLGTLFRASGRFVVATSVGFPLSPKLELFAGDLEALAEACRHGVK